ncbi:DNA-directed DNA polymerase eta rad30 [Extremus antarcticus]|uniref:DNA polymerase eta n=1 Tax=Extremus antarcticus TaxID=702011 RepID=A0AAJ0DBB1_9PEZI|nr:DNA-directed DNA polymerase eta rad30 [Extremus antarcticus]
MSSSQFFASSPFSPNSRLKRRSKFTYKHLSTLAHSATNCPLRVIAHIDLDAFYAQCETVRLGIDPTKPLAVQQWQGLIAINYPARAFGLSRHVTISEAKEKCPELICQHVATWKEGDTKWSYSDDSAQAFREIHVRKVSLDPYRIESRKILATIKDCLPKDLQKVEKASIDEVFVDLSAQVHSIMLERYPELQGPPPYDDPTECLPRPPTTALDWAADALVDVDSTQSEEDDPDWDDIAILIASEIVRDVRAKIKEMLHYTCSAGISRNKMLAKLGSGHKKPNSQTVIRNRAVQHFLSSFKFTKIRNLGGKLGDQVVAAFNTDTVSDLLPVPVEQLKRQLGDDTGSWLYSVLRGEDQSEVNPRTAIKSMLSAKSFRPSINSFEVACKWLRIFVADIFSRLVEEGVLENKRRPKTINLHHRQGAQTRSKQAPIPMGRIITEDALFDLAKNLLAQVVVDGRAWPCANLSLSVGGFEDGVTGNKGIGGFLVRREEAKALNAAPVLQGWSKAKSRSKRSDTAPPSKRRKKDGSEIANFFGAGSRETSLQEEADLGRNGFVDDDTTALEYDSDDMKPHRDYDEDDNAIEEPFEELYSDPGERGLASTPHPPLSQPASPLPGPQAVQSDIETHLCTRCSKSIPVEKQSEHEDFHFAQDLQNQHSSQPDPPPRPIPPAAKPSQAQAKPRGRGRPPLNASGQGGVEKGQRKLAFG